MSRKNVKTKMLMIRLTEEEHKAFEAYSEQVDIPMARILREYIKEVLKNGEK